jgi:hypothetical protein
MILAFSLPIHIYFLLLDPIKNYFLNLYLIFIQNSILSTLTFSHSQSYYHAHTPLIPLQFYYLHYSKLNLHLPIKDYSFHPLYLKYSFHLILYSPINKIPLYFSFRPPSHSILPLKITSCYQKNTAISNTFFFLKNFIFKIKIKK